MVVRWVLEDPATATSVTFLMNPQEGGTPARKKTIGYQNTAAPGGKVLVFEGRDEVQKIDFSGVILEEAMLDIFNTWFEKRNQVLLTDDLGRQYWIYIISFEPKRVRSRNYWRHTYSVSAVVLDVP